MKVTLIRPPAYSSRGFMGAQLVPYLGVVYLGAALRIAGHDVDIVDMCGEDISRAEIVRGSFILYGMPVSALRTRLRPADVFGFTCMFSQDWPFHRELIGQVREWHPGSVFFAGGEHVSALPEYCLKDCPALDICVVGEGERVAEQLLQALQQKTPLTEVAGLVIRFPQGGAVRQTPRAPRIQDIDALPWPAWDLVPLENYLSRGYTYHIRRGRTIPILATRGCPYQCTFCSNTHMWGRSWVPRNARDIVDEMEHYIKEYHADNFVFSDLTAVIKKENIIGLCEEIIQRKIRVTWQLPTLRTEAVDRFVLERMRQAGCRDLDFAMESGSRDVLKSVRKKNDPEKMFQLIRDGLEAGMNLSTNIIIGLPQEGWKDFFQTFRMVSRLAVKGLQELNVFPFIPYPGSELFNDFLRREKLTLSDDYFLNLFGYADLSKAVSWSEHFGPRTLSVMRFLLLSHFYSLMLLTHPRRVWRLACNAFHGKTTTKLEGVLARILRNIKISFKREHEHADG